MSGVASLLRRLRGRSPAELRDRLLQAAAIAAERRGRAGRGQGALDERELRERLADGVPHEPAALLERFRTRAPARVFGGLADPTSSAALVRARCPDAADEAVRRAERVLAGRFDLLGHEGLDFGDPVDWHLEPVAGRRAPLVHWSRIPYLDHALVGDHKVVWELNRMQWLVPLGQAWRLTGDARYERAFVAALTGWLDANPPKLGINWASSLEIAFRAMSWLWALHLFRDSALLTPALFARVLGVLELHGRHLERHLSTWFSPNTHLTGEALGLVHLGLLLPELRRAPHWRRVGLEVLETWLGRQVRADGTYFEQATQYHRYTTEFYLHLHLLAEANGVRLAAAVRPTLGRLCDVLLFLQRPDGTIPLFGDDDGGRLVQLDARDPADVRSLLATAGVALGRPDLLWAGRGDVAALLWLMGPSGAERLDAMAPQLPRETSRAFPDGGFYAMRDGWGEDASWLVADAGPHGVMNCGHAHADALAIEVGVGGRPVLVDAGTYSYCGAERNEFRTASAHNAVIIDATPASVPTAPFQWDVVAHAVGERWLSTPRFDFWEGGHDGYLRLADPARVRRAVLFLKGDYWVVLDRLEVEGTHRMEWRWRCAPGLGTCIGEGGATIADSEGSPLLRVACGDAVRWREEAGWVSPTYGRRLRAAVLVGEREGKGSQAIATWLLPAGVEAGWPHRRSCEGGQAFALRRVDGGEDLLLLGEGGTVRAADVETDARWLWMRRRVDGAPLDWVALDATRLLVGERALLAAAERRPWVTMDEQSRDVGAPAGSS